MRTQNRVVEDEIMEDAKIKNLADNITFVCAILIVGMIIGAVMENHFHWQESHAPSIGVADVLMPGESVEIKFSCNKIVSCVTAVEDFSKGLTDKYGFIESKSADVTGFTEYDYDRQQGIDRAYSAWTVIEPNVGKFKVSVQCKDAEIVSEFWKPVK